jgi:hypothetical protein
VVSLAQYTATSSTAMSKGKGWPVASTSSGPPALGIRQIVPPTPSAT